MTPRLVAGLGGIALMMLLPVGANAQCTNSTNTPPDGRFLSFVVPAAGDVVFFFNGSPGRSYSVEVTTPTNATSDYSIVMGDAGDACPTTNIAGLNVTTNADPPGSNRMVRASFITTAPGAPFYVTRFTNSSGAAITGVYSVIETTMFSPTWSTAGAFDTFYSFQNTTNGSCGGTLILRDANGTARSTATFVVNPGATFATSTSALGTARNIAGTATLTHNCPPGAFVVEAAVANFSINPTPYIQIVKFQSVRTAH